MVASQPVEHHLGDSADGRVEEIDEGVARVLIGADAEEWFFTLSTLPDDVAVGDCLVFVPDGNGRWQALGRTATAPTASVRSIEDRLNRHIAVRKTGEIDPASVRAARRAIEG